MEFAAFYEYQAGAVDDVTAREHQMTAETIAQVKLAEELGWDAVWAAEHHFLQGYSASSAPEVFLGWLAGQTERIRLGFGVVLLSPKINHPWRVAERVASLDMLSKGRVEFGCGRGISKTEIVGYGDDPACSREAQLEMLDMLPHMLAQHSYRPEGKHFDLPERSLRPKPVQQPHPPMWLACSQPETWEIAGKRGLGALTFTFGGFAMVEAMIGVYRAAFDANGAPYRVTRRVGVGTMMYCAPTDDEALETFGNHVRWFVEESIALGNTWAEGENAEMDVYREKARAVIDSMPAPPPELVEGLSPNAAFTKAGVLSGMFCVGSPDTCTQFIQRYEEMGVDHLIMMQQIGTMQNEDIQRSMRLFSAEVLPGLAGAS